MKTLIVGAGISGLAIGHFLRQKFKNEQIQIVEKSRGVGGRFATRRTDQGKFDHGTQFYIQSTPVSELHRIWDAAGLVEIWYEDQRLGTNQVACFKAKEGMTALAKHIANDPSLGLEIKLDSRALRIERDPKVGQWKVEIESQNPVFANRLIMTAPMPQNLEILDRSGIPYDANLRDLKYSKAVVLLLEGVNLKGLAGPKGFQAPGGKILSVADQFQKGLSKIPSLTVVMTPGFSDEHFDLEESKTIASILEQLKTFAPSLDYRSVQLKKWRYCQPLLSGDPSAKTEKPMFFNQVADGLFLAGDSFGQARDGVSRAIESAKNLVGAVT